jgi:hypothetical protein
MDERRMRSKNQKAQKMRNRRAVILLTILTLVVGIALAFFYIQGRNKPDAEETPTPSPTAPVPTETESPTPEPAPTETPDLEPTPTPTPEPTPDPDEDRRSTRRNDVKVRALYLNPRSVRQNLDHYIELANKTEINAFVIDIKRDEGIISYDSDIPDVNAAKGDTPDFDIREVTKKLHENDIIVIARMVTFKDTTITKYKPELAIKTVDGGILETPESGGGKSRWLDPTNRDTWDYILSIAQEAVEFGFDEIQFDYIRFPETTLYKNYVINLEEGKERHEVIEEFIRYIRNNLPPDTVLSADIFGMPLISSRDYGEIGQTLETIGWSLDYICPMIYPSHFANNSKGTMGNGVGQTINGIKFTHPDLKPYDVVYNTLIVGKSRIEKVEGYNLNVRPYIQGFTASYLPEGYYMTYGVEVYRAQIQAVYDAGYDEWIFWNSPNSYVESAFLPE